MLHSVPPGPRNRGGGTHRRASMAPTKCHLNHEPVSHLLYILRSACRNVFNCLGVNFWNVLDYFAPTSFLLVAMGITCHCVNSRQLVPERAAFTQNEQESETKRTAHAYTYYAYTLSFNGSLAFNSRKIRFIFVLAQSVVNIVGLINQVTRRRVGLSNQIKSISTEICDRSRVYRLGI